MIDFVAGDILGAAAVVAAFFVRGGFVKAESTLEGTEFLKYAREIVAYHHDKLDGTGYPFRIAGERIPFTARIMAITDVYDALVSERPYKKAFPHEKAVEIIASESGEHFRPAALKVFLECADEFRDISKKRAE